MGRGETRPLPTYSLREKTVRGSGSWPLRESQHLVVKIARETRPAPLGRAASMRRSFLSPASTVVRFFAQMIQAGSRWQSSKYIQEHQ